MRLAEVAEVAYERWKALAQREGQSVVEMVVGRHAVRDGPGVAEEDVTGDMFDHV